MTKNSTKKIGAEVGIVRLFCGFDHWHAFVRMYSLEEDSSDSGRWHELDGFPFPSIEFRLDGGSFYWKDFGVETWRRKVANLNIDTAGGGWKIVSDGQIEVWPEQMAGLVSLAKKFEKERVRLETVYGRPENVKDALIRAALSMKPHLIRMRAHTCEDATRAWREFDSEVLRWMVGDEFRQFRDMLAAKKPELFEAPIEAGQEVAP